MHAGSARAMQQRLVFSFERMQEDKEAAAGGRGSSAGSSGVDVCTPAILKCLGYAKCTKVDV
jgi:hypothetical protein